MYITCYTINPLYLWNKISIFKDNWNMMGEIFLVEVKCIFRKILRFDWFILKIYILERRKFFRIWETGENFSFERKLNLFKCLNRSNGKIALNIKFLNKLFFFLRYEIPFSRPIEFVFQKWKCLFLVSYLRWNKLQQDIYIYIYIYKAAIYITYLFKKEKFL